MSLAQLTPVCFCRLEVSGSNFHPSIYYNTFAKKKKKIIYSLIILGETFLGDPKYECCFSYVSLGKITI